LCFKLCGVTRGKETCGGLVSGQDETCSDTKIDVVTPGRRGMKGKLKCLEKEEKMAWGNNENGMEKEEEKSALNKVQWLELKDQ